jgi:hypothetical protein
MGRRDMFRQDEGLSACVISYNRAAILGTCLRALHFADEVLVIDKTSTDGARDVAARFADRVVTIPWSPTVEETRPFAVSLCRHDWILLLDDDECLSPELATFISNEMRAPRADVYAFPLRHYILGEHDERAYYWPEHHVRLFRRGAVSFGATVHGGMTVLTDRVMRVSPDAGACIHHLSHPDVAGWIERTNRYTSRPDRVRANDDHPADLLAFAHSRLDAWAGRGSNHAEEPYLAAVAVLRAVYDIVDRLKTWEEERGQSGHARFRQFCAMLDRAHEAAGRSCQPRLRGRPWHDLPRRIGAAVLMTQRVGWSLGGDAGLNRPTGRRPPE